jgi:hypothetical protein
MREGNIMKTKAKKTNVFRTFFKKLLKEKSLKKKLNKIGLKLIASFMLLIIPIVVLGTVSYKKASDSVKLIAEDSTIETMKQSEKYLVSLLENVESISMQIFMDKGVQEYLSMDNNVDAYEALKKRQEVEKTISNLFISSNLLSDVVIISKDRRSFSTSTFSIYDMNIDEISKLPHIEPIIAGGGKAFWVGEHSELEGTHVGYKPTYSMSLVRPIKSLSTNKLLALMSKPTVSLVLGGGHSIGVPMAVSTKYSFIASSATMTIHPIRLSGLIIGVPQAYEYFDRMQERVVQFVSKNSNITREKFRELMLKTGELANDVGTVLFGEEAVKNGLISEVGGLSRSLEKLYSLIEQYRLENNIKISKNEGDLQ